MRLASALDTTTGTFVPTPAPLTLNGWLAAPFTGRNLYVTGGAALLLYLLLRR